MMERLQGIVGIVADQHPRHAALAPTREGSATGKDGDLVAALLQAAAHLEHMARDSLARREAVVGQEGQAHGRSQTGTSAPPPATWTSDVQK